VLPFAQLVAGVVVPTPGSVAVSPLLSALGRLARDWDYLSADITLLTTINHNSLHSNPLYDM